MFLIRFSFEITLSDPMVFLEDKVWLETLDLMGFQAFMETRVTEVKTADIVQMACQDSKETVAKTVVVDTLDFKEIEDCLVNVVTRVCEVLMDFLATPEQLVKFVSTIFSNIFQLSFLIRSCWSVWSSW